MLLYKILFISIAKNIKNILTIEKKSIISSMLHYGTEQESEQVTATGDIATGDLPSDLPSSGPVLSDPSSDLPSSGPALSDPTPDGPPLSPDDHFLPPPGWLESPDPSLQILASSASTISESLSGVVVPASLR